VFAPALGSAAASLERVLGGNASIRRRLERADLPMTVQEFRVEQVLWGLAGFTGAAGLSVLVAVRSPGRTAPLLVLCAAAFVMGVLLRENRLSSQVTERERQVLAEFPTIAELLALAVGAGEGAVGALERVCRLSQGELSAELRRCLADARAGAALSIALQGLGDRTGLPSLARFVDGMVIAVERGTPLAEVLRAQAQDVRESGRRAVMEAGGKKEIAMMVPVVFLVLPVTVLFAVFPGFAFLRFQI
jgi:tight adherence protein C